MPTFGHTTTDGNNPLGMNGWLGGYTFSCPSPGTASSMAAYVRSVGGTGKCALAIYKDSDESLVGYTEEKTLPNDWSWITFNFITPPTLDATDYHLVLWGQTGGDSIRIQSKVGASKVYINRSLAYNYPNFPDPSGLTPTTKYYEFLIYCTYSTTITPTPSASGLWPREYFISGYLPRYQKRQMVGYHSASGDLREIEVNASGHLFTDIEVVVSSGLPVVISGQPVTISGDHVFVESGVYVIADIAESGMHVIISGQPVTVSGDHVFVESGAVVDISGTPVTVSGDHVFVESGVHVVIESGIGVTATVVTDVSGQPIHVGCADTIRTGKLVCAIGGTSGSVPGSGGMSLCLSGYWCSGPIHTIILKSMAGNDDVYIGGVNCKPYSGYGFALSEKEAINLDFCDVCDIWIMSTTSGQCVTWIGTDY